MEEIKVSIIVPVYNVENYLEECINSIVFQDYSNWELLLIDDGSSDGSASICDKYSNSDPRIVTIHQENRGASVARNRGIDLASGKYVMFVDSDDYIENSMLMKMIQAMEEESADLVICGYARFTESYVDRRSYSKNPITLLKSKEEIGKLYTKPETNMFGISIWAKLYRNEVLQSEKIRFNPSISYEEDCQFNVDYFEKINCAIVLSDVLYYYRQMEISLSKGYKKNTFGFLVAGYNRRLDFVKTYAPKASLAGLYSILLIVVKNTAIKIQSSSMGFFEKIREYRKLLDYDEVQFVATALGKSKNRLTRLLQHLIPLKSGLMMFLALWIRGLYNSLNGRNNKQTSNKH